MRNDQMKTFLLCAAALLAAESAAQSSPGKIELTPIAGYRFGGTFDDTASDASAELDDGAGFGLIVNVRDSGKTQWEVIYAQQGTSADLSEFALADPSLDVDLQTLQFGGTYLGDGNLARPYLAATIGGTHISPASSGTESDTFWSFSIGVGLQVFPTDKIGLRLEARAWGTLLDSSSDLFCSSGPLGANCAISVDGTVLWQLETFAGAVFRF